MIFVLRDARANKRGEKGATPSGRAGGRHAREGCSGADRPALAWCTCFMGVVAQPIWAKKKMSWYSKQGDRDSCPGRWGPQLDHFNSLLCERQQPTARLVLFVGGDLCRTEIRHSLSAPSRIVFTEVPQLWMPSQVCFSSREPANGVLVYVRTWISCAAFGKSSCSAASLNLLTFRSIRRL